MERDTVLVHVHSVINSERAVTTEDGDRVFSKIDEGLTTGKKVIVDFSKIEMLISTFLNASIGQLYSKYNSKILNENLSVINLSKEDLSLLIKVIERAKEYFRDKDNFDKTVNDSL